MPVTDFDVWNPAFHLSIVSGAIPSDEMRARTTRLVLVDRKKEFDYIEWELYNADGLLTRPEYLGVGMIVRIRMGYLDATFPWKAFVINRVNGGVGVWGNSNPNVGDQMSTVVYSGRNRNAPGGKYSSGWKMRHRAPPGGRQKAPSSRGSSLTTNITTELAQRETGNGRRGGKKSYPSTSDITGHDSLHGSLNKPRYIPAKSSSEAVQQIAQRNGFKGRRARIQQTYDSLEGVTIRPGISDMEFLQILADRFDFECEISDNTLHWHSAEYLQESLGGKVVETLWYGGGPDLLDLSIDADFRLPVPSSMKLKSARPGRREAWTGDLKLMSEGLNKINMGVGFIDWMESPQRKGLITRDYVEPVIADNLKEITEKASRRFVERHIRAFTLMAKCVGNPRLRAGALVRIKGTGSPFVDHVWEIWEARHELSSDLGYETMIRLRNTTKAAAASGPIEEGWTGDPALQKAKGRLDSGVGLIKGANHYLNAYTQVSGTTPEVR